TRPGSRTVPFFGIKPTKQELEGNTVGCVLFPKNPWPTVVRSVQNDHNRYLETYLKVYR
ncbi:hypothetical protein BU15DRAFT_22292, partial [Melanogaster broomeanus]